MTVIADYTRRHLVHVFPTFAVGGSQRRFAQLVSGLGGHFHHTVLTLDGDAGMASLLPEGSPVELISPGLSKPSGPSHWAHCCAWLTRLKPDCLVTYNWGAMDWCIANRLGRVFPHVHVEDGFGPDENATQIRRRVLTRRLVLSGRHCQVVVPSRSLERLAREVWKLPADNLHYIPNGVDCERFAKKAVLDGEDRPLVIGTVATLRREKNLERLIDIFSVLAAATTRSLKLVIVGDGPERDTLERRARASAANRHIRLAGPSSTPERELAGFDIFALTSDTEQMPLSVLEAMASGLPILSFGVGDVPCMVAEANRSYASIALDNEAGYCQAAETLIAAPGLRRQIGAENRAEAQRRFDNRLMLERYAQLFDGRAAAPLQYVAE